MVCVVGIVSAMTPAKAFAETGDIIEAIQNEIAQVGRSDADDLALKALRARPREMVIKAVRELLQRRREEDAIKILQVAVALELKELIPDFKAMAKTSGSWEVFLALGQLATPADRAEIQRLSLERLSQTGTKALPASAKLAIIDSFGELRIPLSRELFHRLLADASYGVREAVARQFFATRETMSIAEQTERLRGLFAVQPYQARLTAMILFKSLPTAERAKLKAAIVPGLCQVEKQPEVRKACTAIDPSGARSPAKAKKGGAL